MVRENNTKQKTHAFTSVVATILVVVLAVLVFLYHDKLAVSDRASNTSTVASAGEPFTYETGSKQMFALMGDNLAIASSTGLQLLDSSGNTASRQVFTMTNPAVCSSGNYSAFYDVGGKSLRVYKDKDYVQMDQDNELISVSLNSSGYMAVNEQAAGYKGCVTVYDEKQQAVYKWYSGSGYTIDADISPDSNTLAVLCVESTGSIIHFFRLDSEKEISSVKLDNELGFKLRYSSDSRLSVLSEKAVHFYTQEGKSISDYSFGENYLTNFELGDDFCAVTLSKYVSGSNVTLISFSSEGKVLGSLPLSDEPVSLFSQKQKLLVLDSDSIKLYSRSLEIQKQNQVSPGYVSAVLLSNGNVLLLSSRYGEEYKFN